MTRKRNRSFSSGALIRCGSELLFYERSDDAPSHPGKLAIFGGMAKAGEDIQQTLIREIGEEIRLKGSGAKITLDKDCIHYVGVLKAGDDNDHDKHIFLVELPEDLKEKIVLGNEGKRLVFMSVEDMMDVGEFVPDLEILVLKNRKVIKKWLDGEAISVHDLRLIED